MARKTKAEKMAADERRGKIEYSLPTSVLETPTAKVATVNPSDYSYVTSDLKRIGLFSVLAFGAEIVLWYFLR